MRQHREFVIHLASAHDPATHRRLALIGVALVAAIGMLAFALSL